MALRTNLSRSDGYQLNVIQLYVLCAPCHRGTLAASYCHLIRPLDSRRTEGAFELSSVALRRQTNCSRCVVILTARGGLWCGVGLLTVWCIHVARGLLHVTSEKVPGNSKAIIISNNSHL